MNYSISSIPLFDKQAKRLAKKYPSFKNDLAKLAKNLVTEPEQGKPLGNNFYKIRLASASKERVNREGQELLPM